MNESRRWGATLGGTVAVCLAGTLTACSDADDSPAIASPPTAVTSDAPDITPDTSSPARSPDTSSPDTSAPVVDTTAGETTGSARDFSAIAPVVEAYLADNDMNGAALLVVDRDEGVVHEEYWGEFGPDRVSLIASSSKMIVAGVLMHLDDAGLLDVDAPVADVVEWGSGNPTIIPAQLVSNSSGLVGLIPDPENPNPAYGPYLCQFLPAGTLQECATQIFTTPDDDPDVVAPDTEFRYGGGQWQVAGAVAEVASGMSWADLVQQIYVEPCGVSSLGFNNHWTQFSNPDEDPFGYPQQFDGDISRLAPTDNPNMEGGAYITAPDYAALLLMHLRGGMCGDTQVLSPEALARMHENRTGSVYGSGAAYGMGWFVDEENGAISDPGAFGATPWLVLDDGYGAYLAVEGDTGSGLADELYELVDEAMTGSD